MDLNDQPPESPEQGRGYPQSRFNLLFIVLILMLIIIGVAQFEGIRAVEPSAISETTLEGDIAAKTAYVYSHSAGILKSQAGQYFDLALKRYEQAAREDPSREVYRRLIILSYERSGKDTAKPVKVDRDWIRESAMWSDIYGGSKLSASLANEYAQRIRRLDLGWYEPIALSHLYSRAGLTKEAQSQRDLAQSQALQTLVLLGLLIFVILMLGLVGLGLLIWYAGLKRKGAESADLPSASDDPIVRSRVAGYLLEAFVTYMFIIVGVQLVGGSLLAVTNIELGGMGEVIATVAVYVISGLIAMLVLSERLRGDGMNWESIGLRSRQPLKDVLWGIGTYAAALPPVLVMALVVQWISRYIPSPENPIVPLFVESSSWVAKLILFLLAVVAAPFFEELFFRGVLFSSLRAKWGVVAGVLISAVVFGSVHPLPIGLLPILVLGAVFAVVFNERGSLLPGMVAHACNNAVAFALLFILSG